MAEQKKMIQELFGENTEYNYEIYFHWYNIIHELGHAIVMFNSSDKLHPADEEQLVNNFAYAYWKYYGEQKKLKALSSIVDKTICKFTAPTHDKESYMDYAKKVWGTEELNSFNNYGWFQFSSVQAAIAQEQSLEEALNCMCSAKVSPKKPETLQYEVCAQMPSKVLSDAVRLMKDWGVLLPQENEIIFCDDVNCQMCRVENLHERVI